MTWIILLLISIITLEVLSIYLNEKQILTSSIWSGYVISSDLGNPQPNITGVSASWTVPYVTQTYIDAYSSAWIGIGGFYDDKTLIQAGTEHDYVDGREFYSAWYEILPDQAIRIEQIEITPGDLIEVSIFLINSQTSEWKIEIKDVTNRQEFSINLFYNSSKLTGEWIVERPTVNNQISSLADFGIITFNDCYASINSNTAELGEYPHSLVKMTNDLSLQLAAVSMIDENNTSFSIQFNNSN